MSANELKRAIETLANQFAEDLMRALGSASFAELAAELNGGAPRAMAHAAATAGGRGGRGGRAAGGAELGSSVDRIVSVLKSAGASGMRSEELRKRVGLQRPDMMRAVAAALSAKRIRKTGEKRATTYFAK